MVKNLLLVFVGSLLGAATVLGYAELRPVGGHPAPTPPPPTQAPTAMVESRFATLVDEMAVSMYARLSPAVVNVNNRRATGGSGPGTGFADRGVGSGVIVTSQGHILTNNHVVDKAEQLEVTLVDGTRVPARLVGSDAANDLAVVQMEMTEEVRSRVSLAPMGDSDQVKPGQAAFAIGNPFGFRGSITSGIVSSVARNYSVESGVSIKNMIQTDTPLNPGNSGGPLINSAGEVIGINTAIESPIRRFVGVGFAVPINTARAFLREATSAVP